MSLVIENVDIHGWEAAIRSCRNPMNSWNNSDSIWLDTEYGTYQTILGNQGPFEHFDDEEMAKLYSTEDFLLSGLYIGPNDHKLLMRLCKGGTEESKWRRFVNVSMDITAPLYWWKEFETYKVGTVCNSCSTMHKIQAKEFTLEDFSCEHLFECDFLSKPNTDPECWIYPFTDCLDGDGTMEEYPLDILKATIKMLNKARDLFLETNDKKYWYQMIQLLPTSYNQRRTIGLNYEVLAKQYRERKNHKLNEWHTYCDWIKTLPYSELITLEET